MLLTLTTVVRLMTTLLTMRGPPQPPHPRRPTKPTAPPHRPRPNPADEAPGAVRIGGPPPGRGVAPRPAVVRIPDPPAGAVGRPTGWQRLGDPHGAVGFYEAPAAVVIQVVHAIDPRRHIASAHGIEKLVG